MPNYYKKIKGKNFDSSLLKMADSSVKGRGDGRISLSDAKRILGTVKDSNTYTGIEKNTMKYIRDNYAFTPEADKWFRTEIKKWAATKVTAKKAVAKQKPSRTVPKKIERKKPARPAPREPDRREVPAPLPKMPVAIKQENLKKSKWRPVWLTLLLIILVVISLSLSPDGRAWIKKNIVPLFSEKEQIKIEEEKTPVLEKAPADEKTAAKEEPRQPQAVQPKPVVVKEEEQGEYYTVQMKDDLVSISEKLLHSYARWKEIYEANRKVIANPNMIYPGQRLKIPDTKENKK